MARLNEMNNKHKRIRVVSVNHSQGGRVPSVGSNERGGAPSSEGVVSIRREREGLKRVRRKDDEESPFPFSNLTSDDQWDSWR